MPEQPKPTPTLPEREAPSEDEPVSTSELALGDFYYEGPYLVFTAEYHLKRGYCCNSNCRHCPYK